MFAPVERCWICDGATLHRYHQDGFDFQAYATQDPELHAYTGRKVWLVRCAACGHGQPEAQPTLPRFFDRMYDQEWDHRWVEDEFEGGSKDFIFHRVLRALETRHPAAPRRLLDVGAHAGRFMSLAQQDGWTVEGIELNARTAACAARRTGAPVLACARASRLRPRCRRDWSAGTAAASHARHARRAGGRRAALAVCSGRFAGRRAFTAGLQPAGVCDQTLGARPMSRTMNAAVTAVFSNAQFAIAIIPGLVLDRALVSLRLLPPPVMPVEQA